MKETATTKFLCTGEGANYHTENCFVITTILILFKFSMLMIISEFETKNLIGLIIISKIAIFVNRTMKL